MPQAIAMAPDLVSIAAGGNDMLRPRTDPDTLAETFDETVRTLLMAGCPVLMFTGSGDGCRGFEGDDGRGSGLKDRTAGPLWEDSVRCHIRGAMRCSRQCQGMSR
jgi:hypothetical protein